MLALNDEAMRTLGSARLEGEVRLGAMEDYAVVILPRLIARFARRHPHVHIRLDAGLTTPMLDRLGVDFDLVLAMHRAEDARGSVLRHERPRWAVGRRGDAACRTPLPLALAPPGCLFRDWAFEALRIADRPWRLAYVSASLGAAAAEGREDRPRTDESGFVPRARPVIFRPAEERWSEHSRSIGSKSPMARPRS